MFNLRMGFFKPKKKTSETIDNINYDCDLVILNDKNKGEIALVDKSRRLANIVKKLKVPATLRRTTAKYVEDNFKGAIDVSDSTLLLDRYWSQLVNNEDLNFYNCMRFAKGNMNNANEELVRYFIKNAEHDRQVIVTMWLTLLCTKNFTTKEFRSTYLEHIKSNEGYYKFWNFGVRYPNSHWTHSEDQYLSDMFEDKWGSLCENKLKLMEYGLEYIKDTRYQRDWHDMYEIYECVLAKFKLETFKEQVLQASKER